MPTINDIGSLKNHPFERLHPSVREKLDSICERFTEHKPRIARLKKLLECVLDITNETLDIGDLGTPKFTRVDKLFCGALLCNSFIELSGPNRYRYYDTWKKAVRFLKYELAFNAEDQDYNFNLDTESCEANLRFFQNTKKSALAEWYWGSWMIRNVNGYPHYLPLVKVFKAHGYEFASEFQSACQELLISRRQKNIRGIKELCEFIATRYDKYSTNDFKNVRLATQFWNDFREYFFITGYNYGAGYSLKTLRNNWIYCIVPFIERYLSKRGLISAPTDSSYKIIPKLKYQKGPNVRPSKDGVSTNYKLTTPVPLTTTDDQAIDILFSGLHSDIAAIKKWATLKTEAHYGKFVLARITGSTPFKPDHNSVPLRGTIEHYQYICSQFQKIGYKTRADKEFRSLFPSPLSGVADSLGLPHSYSLAPFAILLVIEHPAITPGFLTSLELYDKQGRMSGLVPQDGHTYLVGCKYRRGPYLAEQKIKLTPQTLALTEQIQAITEPLRKYLKSIGDDNWRKLFLCCGKGFGYPRPVCNFFGNPKEAALDSIQDLTGITDEHAEVLRRQISLDSIRATMGVIAFLETESLTAASRELGHASFSTKLLKSYIPEPLLEFFVTRWMRIFQQAIVLHSLKNSPFILQASGMQSMDEIHEFLKNHALKVNKRREQLEENNVDQLLKTTEVIFFINEDTLVILLSIIMASELENSSLKPKFVYWLKISRGIIQYIESPENHRQDFKQMLARAKLKANHTLVEGYSYA